MARSLSTLVVNLVADISKYEKSLKKAGRMASKLGKSLTSIGASLTKGLTLPLAAVGTASVVTAAEFETSMSKIQGLVGKSAEEVDRLSSAVLDIAATVGKGPNELAEGLFFLTSAGLKSADALEALKFAAKASAGGLGDVDVIARATSAAMQAYGTDVLSAEQATDILAKAVEQAAFSAEELAPAIGAVIPIASAAGVSFDQVAAAAAAMSRTGTPAGQAINQLRGIITTFLKPTEKAEKTLSRIGTSADQIRKNIREKGLLPALTELTGKLKSQGIEVAEVFRKTEALAGVLDLTGANAKQNAEVFDNLTKSAGKVEEIFAVAANTISFKFNAAIAKVRIFLIELAGPIMEGLKTALDAVNFAIDVMIAAWTALSPEVQIALIAVGAFIAFLGPLVIALGTIVSALGFVITGLSAFVAAVTATKIAVVAGVTFWVAAMIAQFAFLLANINTLKTIWTAVWTGMEIVFGFSIDEIIKRIRGVINWLLRVIKLIIAFLKIIPGPVLQKLGIKIPSIPDFPDFPGEPGTVSKKKSQAQQQFEANEAQFEINKRRIQGQFVSPQIFAPAPPAGRPSRETAFGVEVFRGRSAAVGKGGPQVFRGGVGGVGVEREPLAAKGAGKPVFPGGGFGVEGLFRGEQQVIQINLDQDTLVETVVEGLPDKVSIDASGFRGSS